MASDVDVASLALVNIGSEPIISLDPPDEDSEGAKICALRFPTARDATLSAHPWNFATRRMSINADATAPVFEFLRAFTIPNDCLRVLKIEGEDRLTYRWRVEEGKIVTDLASPIKIQYIAQVTDAEAWSPLFVEAFAAHLGSLIAEKLSGVNSVKEEQIALFQAKLAEARSKDGMEQTSFTTDDTNDYSWLRARFRGPVGWSE